MEKGLVATAESEISFYMPGLATEALAFPRCKALIKPPTNTITRLNCSNQSKKLIIDKKEFYFINYPIIIMGN